MVKCAWIGVFVLVAMAGVAPAQSQVRLEPGVDGALIYYGSIGNGTWAGFPFTNGPSTMHLGSSSDGNLNLYSAYVVKFDVSGIDRVLDARLVVYLPYVYFPETDSPDTSPPDAYYLAWLNGGNESGSPGTVNLNDLPNETGLSAFLAQHVVEAEGGMVPPPPGIPYYAVYWDITEELNSDLPSGHSDFVISMVPPIYGGPMRNQRIFTTHLGQPNGPGDTQGSPFGPNILYTPSAIPEPGTLAMLGLGLVSLGVAYRRRRKKAA